MVADGVRAATHAGFGPTAWSATWLDELRRRRPPVFAIDNVAEYFYDDDRNTDLESWAIEEDFPLLAPAFEQMFFEYATPTFTGSVPKHAGVLIQAIDFADLPSGDYVTRKRKAELADVLARARQSIEWDASADGRPFTSDEVATYAWWTRCVVEGERTDEDVITAAISFPPPGVRWLLQAHLVLEYPHRLIVGPLVGWRLAITMDGRIARPLGANLISTSYFGPELEAADGQDPLEAAHRAFTPNYLYPVLLALSFLHAKNVSIEEIVPAPKLAKARKRRTGHRPVRYHVLRIEALKETLRTDGRADETGLRQALHLCRGHFKTYTADSPLMGRHVGTYWWAPQVRGTAKRIVLADYAMDPPAESSSQT